MKSVHSKTAIFYVLAVLRYVLNCDKCNCRVRHYAPKGRTGATTTSNCAPTMERGERHERNSQICRSCYCRIPGTTVNQKFIFDSGCFTAIKSYCHSGCCPGSRSHNSGRSATTLSQ